MKKLIITFLIISGTPSLMFMACCKEETPHWQPTSIENITAYYDHDPLIDSTHIDSINLFYFEVLLDVVYVQTEQEHGSSFSTFFTPQLYATKKCPPPGNDGLLVHLEDIIVTCDQPYNDDFDAGERLDKLLNINSWSVQEKGLSYIIDGINNHANRGSISFGFIKKPNNETFKKFTIQLVFQNGDVLEGQTPGVWL